MPDTEQLIWAQLAALGAGVFFAAAEYGRLRRSTERPVIWAFLEGVRMWGFIAISEAAIWYALRNSEPAVWIACGVLAPIMAALVFNNLHVLLHRKLILDRAE